MEQRSITEFKRLENKIKTALFKKEFENKRNFLIKLAAISTGLCEHPEECSYYCPLYDQCKK